MNGDIALPLGPRSPITEAPLDIAPAGLNHSRTVALAHTTTPLGGDMVAILHQFARELATPLELNDILQHALLAAVQLVGAQHATLLLLDETGSQIRYRVALHNGNLAPLEMVAKPLMDKGLAGWVTRTRTSALVQDTEQDQRWLPAPGLGDLRSALVAPLVYAGRTLGILTLGSETPRHYVGEHIYWIEILGAQAAAAIQMAQTAAQPAGEYDQTQLDLQARAQTVVALAARLYKPSGSAAQQEPEACFEELSDSSFHAMTLAIGRYQGTIVRADGEMLLAVFNGLHCEAAAAHAALELQAIARHLHDQRQPHLGRNAAGLQIGGACGRAVLGSAGPQQGRYAFGQPIGQASRLSELARAGEIILAESIGTMIADQQDMQLVALPPIQFDGLAPQKLYRLQARIARPQTGLHGEN